MIWCNYLKIGNPSSKKYVQLTVQRVLSIDWMHWIYDANTRKCNSYFIIACNGHLARTGKKEKFFLRFSHFLPLFHKFMVCCNRMDSYTRQHEKKICVRRMHRGPTTEYSLFANRFSLLFSLWSFRLQTSRVDFCLEEAEKVVPHCIGATLLRKTIFFYTARYSSPCMSTLIVSIWPASVTIDCLTG